MARNRRLWAVLAAATLAFIWGNSLMPAVISSSISQRAAEALSRVLGDVVMTSSGHGTLRKLAHGTEFLLLGVELAALLRPKRAWSLLALGGLGAAFLDETIQLFVAGRDGKIADVWIDLGGFAAGCLLSLLIARLRQKKK